MSSRMNDEIVNTVYKNHFLAIPDLRDSKYGIDTSIITNWFTSSTRFHKLEMGKNFETTTSWNHLLSSNMKDRGIKNRLNLCNDNKLIIVDETFSVLLIGGASSGPPLRRRLDSKCTDVRGTLWTERNDDQIDRGVFAVDDFSRVLDRLYHISHPSWLATDPMTSPATPLTDRSNDSIKHSRLWLTAIWRRSLVAFSNETSHDFVCVSVEKFNASHESESSKIKPLCDHGWNILRYPV